MYRINGTKQIYIKYLFDRGRLVEEGTHEELIRRGGRYATLHRIQAGKADVA